ncbi:MAG: SpoVA/SpoVAEb family sporulation membrane protein [Holdemania massiliensis]
MGIIGQGLLTMYQQLLGLDAKAAAGPMVITVVFVTALLTGLGIYDKLAQKCGAGLFIPISGFANSLTSCAMEGRSEGPIYGIGSTMFKLAGSVLTYGIAAAYTLGLLRWVVSLL